MKKEEKKFKTVKEKKESISKIRLDGVENLHIEKVTEIYKVVKEIHPITNKPFKVVAKEILEERKKYVDMPLKEVSAEELKAFRKAGIPYFVLAKNGKYYYLQIDTNTNFTNVELLGVHMCAAVTRECQRLTAASDENGGCEKVRNKARWIEKYPWIKLGYETFGTKYDMFKVVECDHYVRSVPKKTMSQKEIIDLKASFTEFLIDYVNG